MLLVFCTQQCGNQEFNRLGIEIEVIKQRYIPSSHELGTREKILKQIKVFNASNRKRWSELGQQTEYISHFVLIETLKLIALQVYVPTLQI